MSREPRVCATRCVRADHTKAVVTYQAGSAELSTRPLGDAIHAELVSRILSGQYAPGEHLVERDLAAGFGTSRVPIREALHRLQRDGLVDISMRRGARVHRQTIEEIEDLFNLREVIEGLGAKLAATHRTDEQVEELRHLHEAYMRDFRRGEHVPGLEKTQRWHDLLMHASGSPALLLAVEGVLPRVNWTLRQHNHEAALVRDREHIMAALYARDWRAAERAARRHTIKDRAIVLAALRGRSSLVTLAQVSSRRER